jgi:hypothetical protein
LHPNVLHILLICKRVSFEFWIKIGCRLDKEIE